MKIKKWLIPVCFVVGVTVLGFIVILTQTGIISPKPKNTNVNIGFTAQCIRTNGYNQGAIYPIVKIIRSKDELNAYYEANKDLYNLERIDGLPAENYFPATPGFLDACDKYNDAYFEKQVLIMVLLEEGTGSTRHKVDSIISDSNGKLCINISTTTPEIVTFDMAEWHILIEPAAETNVGSESDVTVLVNGINRLTHPKTVSYGADYANITLSIANDWEYTTEKKGANEFGIAFWPKGRSEGKIRVKYSNSFGVCGTGLKTEKIKLGNYEAYKGTYYGEKLWYYIALTGVSGDYVVINDGADVWWDEYGEEAMQILSTLKAADVVTSES